MGYFPSNSSILACNVCQFSYRFEDLTNTMITTNIESGTLVENGTYINIDTSRILQPYIRIQAEDIFGQITYHNISVLPLSSTSIKIYPLTSSPSVSTFCLESSPSEE